MRFHWRRQRLLRLARNLLGPLHQSGYHVLLCGRMSALLTYLMTLFCRIRSALRVKCEQYLRAFHEENIESTRMLLETEKWLRITTPLMDGDDQRSLIGLIEKRSGYSFERKVREDLTADPIYSRRVFPSFSVEGNPFSALKSIEWLSMKQGIRFHHETKGGTNNGDMTSLRNCNNQALPVATSNESEFVLTSSSLAGFIRYVSLARSIVGCCGNMTDVTCVR